MESNGNIKRRNNAIKNDLINEELDAAYNSVKELESVEIFNEDLKASLIKILLLIEDNGSFTHDKTGSVNRRIRDLINAVYDLQEAEEERQKTAAEFDRINEIIETEAEAVNSIYYLGVLRGLAKALNEQKYKSAWEDAAEYVLHNYGSYFHQLESVEELKQVYEEVKQFYTD